MKHILPIQAKTNKSASSPVRENVKPQPIQKQSKNISNISTQFDQMPRLAYSIAHIPILPSASDEAQYEREADQVAQQIMSEDNATADLYRSAQQGHVEKKQRRRQLVSSITPLAQRKKIVKGEEAQTQLVQPQAITNRFNRESVGDRVLERTWNSGRPLPSIARGMMEQAFGADFRSVKIHTDIESDKLNRLLNSRAFTIDQNLFFRQGAYNPESKEGQEILAHELTHVLQQRSSVSQQFNRPSTLNAPEQKSQTPGMDRLLQPHPLIQRLIYPKQERGGKSKQMKFDEVRAQLIQTLANEKKGNGPQLAKILGELLEQDEYSKKLKTIVEGKNEKREFDAWAILEDIGITRKLLEQKLGSKGQKKGAATSTTSKIEKVREKKKSSGLSRQAEKMEETEGKQTSISPGETMEPVETEEELASTSLEETSETKVEGIESLVQRYEQLIMDCQEFIDKKYLCEKTISESGFKLLSEQDKCKSLLTDLQEAKNHLIANKEKEELVNFREAFRRGSRELNQFKKAANKQCPSQEKLMMTYQVLKKKLAKNEAFKKVVDEKLMHKVKEFIGVVLGQRILEKTHNLKQYTKLENIHVAVLLNDNKEPVDPTFKLKPNAKKRPYNLGNSKAVDFTEFDTLYCQKTPQQKYIIIRTHEAKGGALGQGLVKKQHTKQENALTAVAAKPHVYRFAEERNQEYRDITDEFDLKVLSEGEYKMDITGPQDIQRATARFDLTTADVELLGNFIAFNSEEFFS